MNKKTPNLITTNLEELRLKKNQPTIGIRKEDKNVWERRTPLVPLDCKELIEMGIKVIVESSTIRCYSDNEYSKIGCVIDKDLSQCDFIIGVKEIPLNLLYPDKTYIFFSHTIKGQKTNMPMLREVLKKNIRLFDYETIRDESGINKGSSHFASIVSAVDFLQGIGKFLLHRNIMSYFLHASLSYMYPSLDEAKRAIKLIGDSIITKGLPVEICPFIFGITSKGTASEGVQEILKLLPHEFIYPNDLPKLFKTKKKTDRVYITIITQQHMYKHKYKQETFFDKIDFYKHPEQYKSTFSERFLPYVNVIFNCMYWDNRFPRIITQEDVIKLKKKGEFRLLGISDVTCDLGGAIELLIKCSSIDNPFYLVNLTDMKTEDDFSKFENMDSSIIYLAVDHLPAEMPRTPLIYSRKN